MSTQYQTNLESINHFISIDEASNLINRFNTNRTGILQGDFQSNDPFITSQTFNSDAISALLAQNGCIGLRAYLGMYNNNTSEDKQGKIVLVLCGVDEDGNDLDLALDSTKTDQVILEDAQLCPPACSTPSLINNL